MYCGIYGIKLLKQFLNFLLFLGAMAGALLAIYELGGFFLSREPEEYNEDWIPLVYADVGVFRSFLEKNDGRLVKINSAIALDLAIPVNHLVHQTCEMDLPDKLESDEGKKDFYSIGLPRFSNDFDENELNSEIYSESVGGLDFPSRVHDKISCLDSLRIELIDPKSLRWGYGGTGVQSLPLSGTFKITSRAFSGPRIEYTLRQVAE